MRPFKVASAAIALVPMPGSQPAAVQDALKIGVGQRGNWNMMIADLGQI